MKIQQEIAKETIELLGLDFTLARNFCVTDSHWCWALDSEEEDIHSIGEDKLGVPDSEGMSGGIMVREWMWFEKGFKVQVMFFDTWIKIFITNENSTRT